MKLLQLDQLNAEYAQGVVDSFGRLPHTRHKDGEYRLRRYSVVELRTTFWSAATQIEISQLPPRSFEQSKELNSHQGGMSRLFEPIEDDVLQGKCMKEACLAFYRANNLCGGQEVEIHHMRVAALTSQNPERRWTDVSPEGVHQDGFDHIAMIGINRDNIEGGELMVYKNKDSNPFVTHELGSGEMIMLDDKELWHNAKPISRRDASKEGCGDWFVLCASE